MRIRPFFWLILLVSCGSVLALACIYQPYVPTILRISMDQKQFVAGNDARLELSLTDPSGKPIDTAQVIPSARMTNMDMDMAAQQSYVKSSGGGTYLIDLNFDMAGPWSITIQTRAPGFAPQQKTVQVMVGDAHTIIYYAII
jgi:hypothetical protein